MLIHMAFILYKKHNKCRNCEDMRVYPKVSRLAAWSKNGKWYSSLPLDAAVSLFSESV
jgi:hypothetical protein